MIKEQIAPNDLEAEEAVIGSLLIDGEIQVDLTPDDFFHSKCKDIYQAMLNVNQIDQVTVCHELARLNKLEEVGGASYLSFIISQTPTSLHANYYADIVKRCSLNRKLITVSSKIASMGFENGDPHKNLSAARDLLGQVNEYLPSKEALTAKELANQAVGYYDSLTKRSPNILMGIAALDEKLGGLLPGESMIIGAPTFTGKTSLAVQIAHHISKTKWVLVATEEMTEQDIVSKFVGQISGISYRLINLGNYPPERHRKIQEAVAEFSELKVRVIKCRNTAGLRFKVEKYKPDFIVVDFLQRLKDRYGKDETSRIGYIARELPDIAKEYKTPMLVLSQFHRAEGENPKPRLTSFRQSGEIEENFDVVSGLWRESYSEFVNVQEVQSRDTQLLLLKNKYRGDVGIIHLNWNKEHERYD